MANRQEPESIRALDRQPLVRPSSQLDPLKLPGREATGMQMEGVDCAVATEFDFELQLIARGQLAAHRTHRAATGAAEHLIGFPQRQPAASDDVAGLLAESGLIRHRRLVLSRVIY